MKQNNLASFGNLLKSKREAKRIGLREVCRKAGFDPSNWSKIERGIMAPPTDEDTLSRWAIALGIEEDSDEFHDFVELAQSAQGIIPQALPEKEMLVRMPAFFRTIRNEKPSKKDLDDLINLIKKETSS